MPPNTDDWQQISAALDQVLELAEPDRPAWLEALAGREPALASRLRTLLDDLAAADRHRFLADSPPSPVAAGVVLGARFGAYTLEGVVGQGGTGTVWRARRSDGRFEGLVAVKVLNAALVGQPSAQRFIREGSVLARLQHPNIAHLLDAGITASGQPYLALEYVEGMRIDRYCEDAKLDIEGRIRLMLDVLDAVAHAHGRLVVHRDLKPDNILVTSAGVVKLLDFGVAGLLAPGGFGLQRSDVTLEVPAGLTPDYAAPEQLLGQPVTTATDVYALGLVLFVLLVGRHPIAGPSRTPAQLLHLTLNTEAPRPSESAFDAGRGRRLRGDLDNIVGKALRKAPAERYQSAAALADDLRRYLAFEPVTARPSTMLYRARRFVRRNRGGVAATAAVALTLMAAVVVTTAQLSEARRQRAAAIQSARRATATKDFLSLVLSEFQTRGEPLTSKALLERSSMLLQAEYAHQPEFVAEMLIELAGEYQDMLEVADAQALLDKARAIALSARNDTLLATVECRSANIDAVASRQQPAERHLAEGLAALARLRPPPLVTRVTCELSEARVLAGRGDRARSILILESTRRQLEREDMTLDPLYNYTLSGLAMYLMDSTRVREAIAYYQQNLEAYRRNGRGDTGEEMIVENALATAYYRMGELATAVEMQRHLAERRALLRSDEDLSVSFVVNAALAAARLARTDPAQEKLPWAIDRAEKAGDLYYFRLASVAQATVRLMQHASRDDVEAPLMHLEHVLAPGESAIPLATQILVAQVRTELDLRDGHAADADRRAEALVRQVGQPQTNRVRPAYLALLLAAKASLAVGDLPRAAERAQAAAAIVEPIARGPDTSADVGEALWVLGRAQRALGRADAERTLARAVRCLTSGYGSDHPVTVAARRSFSELRGS